LILLTRIERLDLLVALAEPLIVPESVFRELQAGSDRDDAADQINDLSPLLRVDDISLPDRISIWDLGAGESQVLAQGLQRPGSEVVLDDLAARRCAHSLDLPVIGTLGIVILCRHRGIIQAARPVVEALCSAGLRLKPELVTEALAKVGE
jgi:predicted nucleic acid-binding protein